MYVVSNQGITFRKKHSAKLDVVTLAQSVYTSNNIYKENLQRKKETF